MHHSLSERASTGILTAWTGETKAAFGRIEKALAKLAGGLGKVADGQVELSKQQLDLAEGQAQLAARMTGLERQVKTHTDSVTRAFTEAAAKHTDLELRMGRAESRLDQLESREP